MFGLSKIISLAVDSTLTKFPNEDKRKLFELSEMVADELSEKQGELFVKDYVKDFVDYKDLAIGDANVFYISK